MKYFDLNCNNISILVVVKCLFYLRQSVNHIKKNDLVMVNHRQKRIIQVMMKKIKRKS